MFIFEFGWPMSDDYANYVKVLLIYMKNLSVAECNSHSPEHST